MARGGMGRGENSSGRQATVRGSVFSTLMEKKKKGAASRRVAPAVGLPATPGRGAGWGERATSSGAAPGASGGFLDVVKGAVQEDKKGKKLGVLQMLAAGKEKLKRPTASRGSRSVQFTSGYLYFLVLESSWNFCLGLALGVYVLAILVMAPVSMAVEMVNTNELNENSFGFGAEHNQFLLGLRFASAHILTMGFGLVLPVSDAGYALAHIQQLLGILINVFVFSAIMAKFQSPQADLVFSKICTLVRRDGVPTLIFRLGNLRCHTLYGPEIRLTLMRRHVTTEGEVFSKRIELDVLQPSTVSGVYSIAHTIDEESPLQPLLRNGALRKCLGAPDDSIGDNNEWEDSAEEGQVMAADEKTKQFIQAAALGEQLMLHATVRALDNVYGGDVCVSTTFGKASVHFGRCVFLLRPRREERGLTDKK